MKLVKTILLTTLIAISTLTVGLGQSLTISYGPESVYLWGRTANASAFKIEYLQDVYKTEKFDFAIGAKFHNISLQEKLQYKKPAVTKNGYSYEKTFEFEGVYNAAFILTNIELNDVFFGIDISQTYGIGYFAKKFPDPVNGVHINFNISQTLSKEITDNISFGLEYNHISNAGTGNINLGIDNVFGNVTYNF